MRAVPGNGPQGKATPWKGEWLRDGIWSSPTCREKRHIFPARWSRSAGRRDARHIFARSRRYRKLEWKRSGFETPRAWAENERLAKALRESGKPGGDVARAKSDATYFMDMIQQSSITTVLGPALVKLAHLIGSTAFMTINEHRAQLGLSPLPGCDVTNGEYAQGIRG